MAIHDWTRVEAGIFHHFHNGWVTAISNALNGGLLPHNYYALTEQHAGRSVADVLTLHSGPEAPTLPSVNGGVAVAEAPPRVRRMQTFAGPETRRRSRRRTLVVRHVSGHRIIAVLEVVSPANKDRLQHVTQFAHKVVAMLRAGVHVLLVDLFPPGLHDPQGMHGAVAHWLDRTTAPYDLPSDEPLTLASYAAAPQPIAYLEHLAVGCILPEMPLFLATERYINAPLEPTYGAAYAGLPHFWRAVLEGGPTPESGR